MAAAAARGILLVRVEVQTMKPTYCDEKCAKDTFWGHGVLGGSAPDSVAGLIKASSYGAVDFPFELGHVRTVSVPGFFDPRVNVGATDNQCHYWMIAKQADDALAAADAEQGTFLSEYRHRIYFLPKQWGGCAFGGLAWYDCKAGQHCKAWLRVANKVTLAHELGHNLGLVHAGIDRTDSGASTAEYGDGSCVMGHGSAMVGINAPNRLHAGWLPSSSVLMLTRQNLSAWESAPTAMSAAQSTRVAAQEGLSARTFWLQQLNGNHAAGGISSISSSSSSSSSSSIGSVNGSRSRDGASAGNLGVKVIVLPRSNAGTAAAADQERAYYISFRTGGGVDKKIAASLRNKVLVHSGPLVDGAHRRYSRRKASNQMNNDVDVENDHADDDTGGEGDESNDADDETEGFMLVAVLGANDAFTSFRGTFTVAVQAVGDQSGGQNDYAVVEVRVKNHRHREETEDGGDMNVQGDLDESNAGTYNSSSSSSSSSMDLDSESKSESGRVTTDVHEPPSSPSIQAGIGESGANQNGAIAPDNHTTVITDRDANNRSAAGAEQKSSRAALAAVLVILFGLIGAAVVYASGGLQGVLAKLPLKPVAGSVKRANSVCALPCLNGPTAGASARNAQQELIWDDSSVARKEVEDHGKTQIDVGTAKASMQTGQALQKGLQPNVALAYSTLDWDSEDMSGILFLSDAADSSVVDDVTTAVEAGASNLRTEQAADAKDEPMPRPSALADVRRMSRLTFRKSTAEKIK